MPKAKHIQYTQSDAISITFDRVILRSHNIFLESIDLLPVKILNTTTQKSCNCSINCVLT